MAYKQLKLWFNKDLAIMLSQKIIEVKSEFDTKKFIKAIDSKIHDLELKDRVEVIADELSNNLTDDYTLNIEIITKILGPENEKETGMFKEFYWIMPIAKYVEKYGLDEFEISMNAIEEITKRNTGEYTIRPFLEKYPERALKQMLIWSKNRNKHVRRLSCEGLRPRLPWAKKLDQFIEDPKPIISVLNNLKEDTSKYVQKSVANCLNDILKDNLKIGREVIEQWNEKPTKQTKLIIKHALRNLLKVDDSWAVKMIN